MQILLTAYEGLLGCALSGKRLRVRVWDGIRVGVMIRVRLGLGLKLRLG
jgi:hypothetical protein